MVVLRRDAGREIPMKLLVPVLDGHCWRRPGGRSWLHGCRIVPGGRIGDCGLWRSLRRAGHAVNPCGSPPIGRATSARAAVGRAIVLDGARIAGAFHGCPGGPARPRGAPWCPFPRASRIVLDGRWVRCTPSSGPCAGRGARAYRDVFTACPGGAGPIDAGSEPGQTDKVSEPVNSWVSRIGLPNWSPNWSPNRTCRMGR